MGGAIFNEGNKGVTVVITNSTFTDNSANGGSGGKGAGGNGGAGAGYGAALFSRNGTVTIINSTFSKNVANNGGRGIFIYGDGGTATASLTNTVIGQNDTNVSDLVVGASAGASATISGQTNLIRTSATNGATNNLTGTLTGDPLLDVLQNNGGLTPTMGLLPGSPAINAGTAAGAPSTDQRGVLRNLLNGGSVDIGAYEARLFANIIVNTAADTIDNTDGKLSLREAIDLANDTLQFTALSAAEQAQVTPVAASVSTITFDSSLNGHTITLSTASDPRVGPSAFLIDSPVVIDGPRGNSGIALAVASGVNMRLFDVAGTGNLTLLDLTLSGGTALGSSGGVDGGAGQGGAIYNQGALAILDSTLTGNTAQGGIGGSHFLGTAGGDGGDGMGGAVFNEAGAVFINNSTFYDNTASGGLKGKGSITDGTAGKGLGGGLYNDNGVITVSESTFSGNTVVQGDGSTLIATGRGIFNVGAPFSATIDSTIIGQADTAVEDFTGTGVNNATVNFDLIRTSSGLSAGDASELITGDPLLGKLQNNGGPTPTMALVAASPAVGKGFVLNGDYSDQRGVPRPAFKVDIGAYQRATLHIVVDTATDETTDDSTLSLREAIELVNGTLSPGELSATEMQQVSAAAFGGPDTVTFDSSLDGKTITLSTVGDTSVGPSAFLIASTIVIDGPGGDSGITLSAAGTAMRFFDVTGNLTLQNLTLSGGTALGAAGGSGNGSGRDGLGGAIFNQSLLTILDCTLTGNTAQGGAGGLGGGSGGAGKGGAIFQQVGGLNITNSTFTGNKALGGSPGAGGTAGQGQGGALFSQNGSDEVKFSTISGNTAANGGRGIFNAGGDAELDFNIIGQSDTDVSDLAFTGGASIRIVDDVIRTMSGTAFSSVGVISGNPLLGLLQDNGGPTRTMALLPGSPAIGVVNFDSGVTTDQRGAYRPLPADIGAYQLRPVFNMVVNTLADDAADTDKTSLSLHEAIDLANGTLQFSALSLAEQQQVTPAAGIVDTITFDSSLYGKTITLSTVGFLSILGNFTGTGTGPFLVNGDSVGPTAFLVNSRIVIDGPSGPSGITLAVASEVDMRLFDVTPSGNLTLQNLTLSGGTAQGFTGGSATNGGAGGGSAGLGGAIFNQGTLTILDSTLTGNTAQGGAGGAVDSTPGGHGGAGGAGLNADGVNGPSGGNGGGPNFGFGGSSFSYFPQYLNGLGGGFGGGGGGGGYYIRGTLSSEGFDHSSEPGSGGQGGFGGGGGGSSAYLSGVGGGSAGSGGFGGGGGALTIPNTPSVATGYGGGRGGYIDYSGYQGGGGGGAGMGGAVFNEAGTVVITDSTFTLNAAIGGAGGAGVSFSTGGAGLGLGGGLFNHNGAITVTNSTFSGNTAADGGRGIVIIADGANATATAVINNTIIGQDDTDVSDLVVNQINGGTDGSALAVVGGGTNLIRTTTVSNSAINVLMGTLTDDPQLVGLAGNGGPTQTMALMPTSPAIGAGADLGAPSTDQRGVVRLGNVDIGAFEFHRAQITTFGPLTGVTYGDADFAISATATSGLPVSFTASGNARVFELANVWFVHITGAGSATITAHQAGDATDDPALDVAQNLAIGKANATLEVTSYSATYNGSPHTASVTSINGVNGETGATVGTVDVSGTTHTAAGIYASDSWSFAGANYNSIVNSPITDTINKATARVVVTSYTVTYDGSPHTASISSINGVNGETGATVGTVDVSATTHTAAGIYASDSWSFAGANYNSIINSPITDTINKAAAMVVVTPYTVTYDGSPHTASITSINGVNGETGAAVGTVDVSGTTHTAAGIYASDSWSFAGANYNSIINSPITDTINKAIATVVVTPYSVAYDGSPHTATITSIAGVNGETGVTVGTVTLTSTHTAAGIYASDFWSFAGTANYNSITHTPITDTINATIPILINPTATSITSTIATLGGTVSSDGGSSLIKRGILYAPSGLNLSLGGDGVEVDSASAVTGAFTQSLTGLKPNTAYSFVAFATNSQGVAYSLVGNFTTTILGPASSITGPTSGKPGQALSFVLNGFDPSPGMQLGRFVFHVIWGDGKSNVVTSLNGAQATHAYAASGTYTVQLSATDAVGNMLPTATWKVTISSTPAASPDVSGGSNGTTKPLSISSSQPTANTLAVTNLPSGKVQLPATIVSLAVAAISNGGPGTYINPPTHSFGTPASAFTAIALVLADWAPADGAINGCLASLSKPNADDLFSIEDGLFLGM